MKKYLLAALAALALGGAAQAQVTNCFRNGYGYSCYSNPVQPRPNLFGSFLNGFIQGRMARLRMQNLELQNELLRRQLRQQ